MAFRKPSSNRWALTEAARFDAFTPAQLFAHFRTLPDRPMLTHNGVVYLLRKWETEGLVEDIGLPRRPDFRWTSEETNGHEPRRPGPILRRVTPRRERSTAPSLPPRKPAPAPRPKPPPELPPRSDGLRFSQVFVVESGSPLVGKRCNGCGNLIRKDDPVRLVFDVANKPLGAVHNPCATQRKA